MDGINWLGHASFFFQDQNGNKIYFVDPFELGERKLEKADLIFITHAHYDHFSQGDIDKIIKDESIIIAPPDILALISIDETRKIKIEPNQSYDVKNFKFSTIPAYNHRPGREEKHPRRNNWVGYIFELNGKKVYHAGDTDFTEEMKTLKELNLDVAMLPMGGSFTMDADDMIEAANWIGAKITIPIHYKKLLGDAYKEAEEKLKSGVTNSKVVILTEFS
ncbi:MAG: MBL fold metallo-hydrolase [Patescibacteria group bacterium]